MKQSHGHGNSLTEVVGLDADRLYPSVYLEDDEAFDHLEMMRLESHQNAFSSLVKKITSGNTVLVLAVLVPRFIMTVEKNTAVVNQAVQ